MDKEWMLFLLFVYALCLYQNCVVSTILCGAILQDCAFVALVCALSKPYYRGL